MDEPLPKVLLFAGRFQVRGSSTYTLRLAEHLQSAGFEVRVVCADATQVASETKNTLQIKEYSYLNVPIWGRFVLHSLMQELSQNPPDLIHAQSREVLSAGAKLAEAWGCSLVLTVHDYLSPKERFRFEISENKRIIAVSQSVKSELLDRTGLPDQVVSVIHSGVETVDHANAHRILDPEHLPVVGTAGPLEAVKGLPFFLGAAQRVLGANPNVQFLIAGAGPEEVNLRRLARDLKIAEHVTFVPNLLDFSTSLSAMDVFCLPSLRQGLGTIMLEAMAMGIPVIATGVGGVYSAVRDNETGLVVPPSDSEQLADRIRELLNDPVRARAIGEAGRRLVHDEFGIEKMVNQTADMYREMLTCKKSPIPTG